MLTLLVALAAAVSPGDPPAAKSLPRISGLQFVGCVALAPETLEQAVAPMTKRTDYTEGAFRHLLDLKIRPLYEKNGFLNVRFSKVVAEPVSSGSVSVTTFVEEGIAYRLGAVRISGADLPVEQMLEAANFPEGALADWNSVLIAVGNMERVLRRRGYLEIRSRIDRQFRDDARAADLTILVTKGPQSHFGQVMFEGLSPELESKARSRWSLQSGDPLDQEYPSEYLDMLGLDSEFRDFRSASVALKTGAGEFRDVLITFR